MDSYNGDPRATVRTDSICSSEFDTLVGLAASHMIHARPASFSFISMQNDTSSEFVVGGLIVWTIGGGFAGGSLVGKAVCARDHLDNAGDVFVGKAYKREPLEQLTTKSESPESYRM